MAAFLWVEDFDGGAFRVTTNDVFGSLAGNKSEIPDDKESLREYLKSRNVHLETTLTDALRFIADHRQLAKIDYVVLDIDLKIADDPEDERENQCLLDEVFKWYEGDETEQRSLVKKVAGYHIWSRLVIESGFPRKRIQFCSQHGEYLDSIKNSFMLARISAPEVFRKGDGRTKRWIDEQASAPYVVLRRNVIDYCDAIASHLRQLSEDSPPILRLAQFPGEATRDFKRCNALEMLETLPRHLPPLVPEENEPEILRAFVRAMTMEWDRFDASGKSRCEFETREQKKYEKVIQPRFRCGASVLKLLRNTLSHPSDKPISIECDEAAMFFVLNMNIIYCLENIHDHKISERKLLPFYSPVIFSGKDEFLICLRESKLSLEEIANRAGIPTMRDGKNQGVGDLLRSLQFASSPEYQRNAIKWIFRMLWHELLWRLDNPEKLDKEVREIHLSPDPIYRVASACVGKVFGTQDSGGA